MFDNLLVIIFLIVILLILMCCVEPWLFKQKLQNKNEHGSARWSTRKEIKKNFRKSNLTNIKEVGFPIFFDRNLKHVWFDTATPHWVYLGSSGSGKSSTSVIPFCSFLANSKIKRSAFITDPKAEVFNKTSKMFFDKGYKVLTIDFREPEKSQKINLLEPCIIEYESYMEHLKKSDKIQNYIETLTKRKKVLLKEDDYISKNFLKLSSDETINLESYKRNLKNNLDLMNLELESTSNEQMNEENLSMSHYAECNRLIGSISSMIMSEKNAKDPFWNNSAKNLHEGIIGVFLEDYKDGKISREQITLTSIKKFQNSTMTEENSEYFKQYIEQKKYGSKSKDSLLSILSSSENTYKSITSVFNEKMAIFDDINVANITSTSDFDFDILGKTPAVLYVIIPDEDATYFGLVTMLVGLIYKELVKLANSQDNKILPIQIDFLLDEFANCPPFLDPGIEKMVSVARSRGMRFHLYIQSFSQLYSVYGRDIAQATLDNCGLCYLKTNTQETADEISKRLGNYTTETNSINYSFSTTHPSGSKSSNLIGRQLLTADEVKQLHFKTIIFPVVGHPIFRDTVFYKKFKCYKSGTIDRQKTHLSQLENTYYTVDDIKSKRFKHLNSTGREELVQKKELDNLVTNIKSEFEMLKYNIDFVEKENNVVCVIGFYNPLSTNKIFNITQLIDEEKYEWKVKSHDIEEKFATELEITLI